MSEIQLARSLLPSQVKLEIADEGLDSEGDQESDRIPFSETTNNQPLSDIDRINRLVKNKNKENKDSPKRVSSPRAKLRQSLITNVKPEESSSSTERSVTPTPESDDIQAPLTPTANLKMLFSAMSPEIRSRDKRKELFHEEPIQDKNKSVQVDELEIEGDACPDLDGESWKPGSRKEKSLGLLCQKFLQKYKEFPGINDSSEISLDEVAKELAVERRRIYDIVNVLESVEIVSRIAKNKYAWHGKTNLINTLGKLKALGVAEGFDEQLRNVKDYELNRELEEQINSKDADLKESGLKGKGTPAGGTALMRKDKSLGIMSQKFLMLFLVSQPKTVNLDLAAKILIGDPNVDRTENSKFKTKIRRLYDIANILTSLDLIRKVHVTEIRGRKPAFKYIGPDVDNLKDISVCYNDGYHRPSSRHSLLDCVKNQHVADLVGPYKPIKPSFPPTPSASDGDQSTSSTPSPDIPGLKKSSFRRNSSFEQICQVAEKERHRLYASMSQPTSPTCEQPEDDFPKSLSQEDVHQNSKRQIKPKGKHIILQQTNGEFKIVNSDGTGPAVTHKLPVQPVTTKMVSIAMPKESSKDMPNQPVAETIVVKTSQINQKQATLIPLTKDQIDAVLKSLKVPVPINKNLKKPGEFQEIVDSSNSATVLEKPKTIVCSMETIVCSLDSANNNKRPHSGSPDMDPSKRIRIEYSTPPSDNDSTCDISSESTSPVVQQSQVKQCIGSNMQQIAVQLPNQSPTILQFPTGHMTQTSENCHIVHTPKMSQSNMSNLTPQMQIIQGVPLSASGVQGQPINFMVPITFSPPLTPQSGSSSPTMFSFPTTHTNQCTFSTVEQLQSMSMASAKLTSPVPVTNHSLLTPTERPILSASQFITPTERLQVPSSKFFGYTPGGFLSGSPSVSIMPSMTKEISSSTARKLDLPDIASVNC
ncbi:transcription factor E2F7-like isoform X2 [Mizuhopecten yessoensis]|uniref:Transcription factor E2F7 n=2 Tax=Mizuhopecten yessoensis TaxID=6573 RepID=A0A210QTB3_MIZYE|nr:transcription factor E2F7-like isoform X2 [Mizuhopecten yessoensis]OWF51979.1 Transcription factor E2F7 [Mizuhopecten yessoensis]